MWVGEDLSRAGDAHRRHGGRGGEDTGFQDHEADQEENDQDGPDPKDSAAHPDHELAPGDQVDAVESVAVVLTAL